MVGLLDPAWSGRGHALMALNLTETKPGRTARRHEAVRDAWLLLAFAIIGAIAAIALSP